MIDFRKFKDVPTQYRPRIRWWIPGTAVDETEIAREIRMMKDAGFAGAEISSIPYTNPETGMQDIGWRHERWYKILKHILTEAKKQDFEIDIAAIFSCYLAVPTITDVNDPSQGAQMELNGVWIDGITREHPYEGPLPVSKEAVEDAAKVNGTVKLHAVTVAKYVDKEKRILSFASAEELDIRTHVIKTEENEISYRVKFVPEDEGEYLLYAWWQHPSGATLVNMPMIDFYSEKGVNKVVEFYEQTVLPALGEARDHITSFFVDSLEYTTHLDFTHRFREQFIKKNGYDFTKYLPAVYDSQNIGACQEPQPDFSFDVHNDQLLHSYGDFLTWLHIEKHLKPLNAFCKKHGMTLRYQPAYGKTLELARCAGYVDIAETETLYGKDYLDFYRAQAGAVHINQKKIYSIEASAEAPGRGNGNANSGNYEQGFKKHLWHLQRAYATGVNQVYFHGCHYRGHYNGPGNENGVLPGVHWPGFDPMGFVGGCANSWDDRQPNWKGMNRLTDYLARTQYILQAGEAKVDLAIYRHSYFDRLDIFDCEKLFSSTVLEQSGYSYDFICPNHITAIPQDCDETCIYKDGPAYKAIIIHAEKYLPLSVAQKLLELTKKGFPVVICGGIPKEAAFFGESEIKELVSELIKQESVRVCDSTEEIPFMLKELNVTADAAYEKPEKVLTMHRKTEAADYFYFYHYADADTYPELKNAEKIQFRTTLKAVGTPYLLDFWTGSITKLASCSKNDTDMTLTLDLTPNDCLGVMVEHKSEIAPCTLEHASVIEPQKILQYEYSVYLKNWALDVESWTEGRTALETKKQIVKTTQMEDPIPWTQLSGLDNVSGVGYYRTAFHLEKGWEDGYGAYLFIPNIEDCYILKINANNVPANQVEPLIDIGRWLIAGENRIEVEVYSTLLNACITFSQKHGISKGGKFVECGMTGPVKLIPYELT